MLRPSCHDGECSKGVQACFEAYDLMQPSELLAEQTAIQQPICRERQQLEALMFHLLPLLHQVRLRRDFHKFPA